MTAMEAQSGPVHISRILAEALAVLWERTCEHRVKTDQPLPPEHLNPNQPNPKGRK